MSVTPASYRAAQTNELSQLNTTSQYPPPHTVPPQLHVSVHHSFQQHTMTADAARRPAVGHNAPLYRPRGSWGHSGQGRADKRVKRNVKHKAWRLGGDCGGKGRGSGKAEIVVSDSCARLNVMTEQDTGTDRGQAGDRQ